MSVTVYGLRELQARLLRLQASVEAAEKPAVRAVGEEVAATARMLVPVDTGALLESIEATDEGAAATDEAAPYVEFGTSNMSAQPFMRPAADEASGIGAVAVFHQAIRRAV